MDGVSDDYTSRRSVEVVCSLMVASLQSKTELCSRLSNWRLSRNGRRNLNLIPLGFDQDADVMMRLGQYSAQLGLSRMALT